MRWITPLVLTLAFASVFFISVIELFFAQSALGRFLTAHTAVVAFVVSIIVPSVALWYFGFAHAKKTSATPNTSRETAASLPAIRMDSVDREFLPGSSGTF